MTWGTVVIGHNDGWKQNVNLGKVNNQNFVSIPFNRLIHMIRYKAEEYGIKVIVREESYTSRQSARLTSIHCRITAIRMRIRF